VLKGNEGPALTCAGCGKQVWPRIGGYWFLLLAPRGRVRFPGAAAAQAVLCSGCGRRVREAIELQGVACGESYERSGKGDRAGVS
jgi:DNA-directed RNA polymerase subunit RPC12/RpoP